MKNNPELYDLILNFLHDLDELDITLKFGRSSADINLMQINF